MNKSTATTKEFIITYYKWTDLQPKFQQYLIDDKDAAEDIIREVICQSR